MIIYYNIYIYIYIYKLYFNIEYTTLDVYIMYKTCVIILYNTLFYLQLIIK